MDLQLSYFVTGRLYLGAFVLLSAGPAETRNTIQIAGNIVHGKVHVLYVGADNVPRTSSSNCRKVAVSKPTTFDVFECRVFQMLLSKHATRQIASSVLIQTARNIQTEEMTAFCLITR
jgi:hypothetical protein